MICFGVFKDAGLGLYSKPQADKETIHISVHETVLCHGLIKKIMIQTQLMSPCNL